MAATYYVDLINTADSYNYRCVYEPLGCDSLRFQMNFSLESFPLYVGGGISVGTLKFIKADADELRTIFSTNALYNLTVRITNIASGLAWDFFADWSNYADDGNFVEIGLTITNIRDRIKAVNLQHIHSRMLWQYRPIENKPALINRFTINEPRGIMFGDLNGFNYLLGLTEKRTINDWDIINGQTLGKYEIMPHVQSRYWEYDVNEVLNYFVPDATADDVDSSLGINIDGSLKFAFDSAHARSVALSTFVTSPQFTVAVESVLRKTTSGGTTTETIVNTMQSTASMTDSGFTCNFAGIFPVYRALKYTDYGINQGGSIYHVVRLKISVSGTIFSNYKYSYFKFDGSMTAQHNIVQLNGQFMSVTSNNVAACVNQAYGTLFDDSDFSTKVLLTTPLCAWQGNTDKNFASTTLENWLQTYSMMNGVVLYEYLNSFVKVKTFDNFIQSCKSAGITINHYYDFKTQGTQLANILSVGNTEDDNGLMFDVSALWGEQRYQLNGSQIQQKADELLLKGNIETNGQRVFSQLVEGNKNNVVMLYNDIPATNLVYSATGYINEYFTARRMLQRLDNYIYSRVPTDDNLTPTPIPTPRYSSQLPTDNAPVDNQSNLTYPATPRNFKRKKVTCKMLLTTSVIRSIIQNPIFSFVLDGKYHYPTSMALGLESDTYEVEMLEFT